MNREWRHASCYSRLATRDLPLACRQAGAALVIGLILMTLLSLLALTAMGTSLLEERMAANARDRIRALQAAEAALRLCEQAVRAADQDDFTVGGTGGLYANPDPTRWQAGWSGWSAGGMAVDGLPLVAQPPRCIAERLAHTLPFDGSSESLALGQAQDVLNAYRHYRITAVGWGQNPSTVVLLQSHARWLQD